MVEPVDALAAETAHAATFLAEIAREDWRRATRCPPMSVRELAVHALRGAYRIQEFLGKPSVEDEPEMDAITYYRYDPIEVGVGVVARAKEESDARPPEADIAAEWRTTWNDAIAVARAKLDDDPVVASPFGTLRLTEYLRTRCVEVTIHHMDLRDALGMAPHPTKEGLEATCDVLRGLLGGDLRTLGMDDVRFALTGTGREKLTDAEREMLGPLSDSFPLLQ